MKKDYLKMFQEGGPMPAPAAAPAPENGGPDEMLAAVVESQDPQLALEFCNMLAQQMGITPGGGAPAEGGATPMGRYGIKIPKIKL